MNNAYKYGRSQITATVIDSNKMLELDSASLDSQSEKAVKLNVLIETATGVIKKAIWFPKTQAEKRGDKIFASAWILGQKDQELGNGFGFGVVTV